MKIQKKLKGIVLAVTLVFVAFLAYAETVTVSTYYPSPYGSYQNLDSSGNTHLATAVGSRVGIGTSGPGQKLHVVGDNVLFAAPGNQALYLQSGGTANYAQLIYRQGAADTWNVNAANVPSPNLEWANAAGSVKMTLTQTGTVGIGTTEPTRLLTLKGRDNIPWLAVHRTDSNTEQLRMINTEGNQYAQGGGLVAGIWTNVIDSRNSNFMITTFDGSGTGGDIILDGNVGIGTTTPDATVDIDTSTVWSGGWLNNLRLTGTNFPALRFFSTNSNRTSMIGNNNDGGLWFGVDGPGDTWGIRYGMVIEPSGDVAIGKNTASERLEVAGNVLVSNDLTAGGNITATTVTGTSDARFKTDIRPLASVLPRIDRLQAIRYKPSDLAIAKGSPKDRQLLGIVGQELEKEFPELVLRSPGPEEYRSVDYGRLSVVLLEAIKEQNSRIKALEDKLREVTD